MKLTCIDRVLGALCLLAAVVYTMPASAAPTLCSNTYTPPTGSTVRGSLVVTATSSSPCVLNDVTVQGSVTVDPDAILITGNGTTIQGALTVTGAEQVFLEATTVEGSTTITDVPDVSGACGSTFGGRVTIENLPYSDGATEFIFGDPNIMISTPATPATACAGNRVLGSLVLYNNANFVAVEDNQVTGGGVTVTDNYGVPPAAVDFAGSVLIKANTISGGALNCTGNTPLSGMGTNNVHGGAETGQCVGF